MIDDWMDIDAPIKAAKSTEPVTFGVVQLRHGAARATFSIDERIMVDVGWPHYRVQWNQSRKQFRITGTADGAFEGFHPPRGPKAASGEGARRIILRVPLPDDLVAAEKVKVGVVHSIDKASKSLIVTVPSRFWARKP